MYNKNELLDYVPLIPNIDKPYANLSKKEAEAYLEWFVSHIDERANYIKHIISVGLDVPDSLLNFSFESLKIVWRWFLTVAETSPLQSKKTGNNTLLGKKTFVNHVLNEAECDFSVQTYYIIRDIGMYVAKVFLNNYPNLEWTIKTKPKNYISVNEPLLVGFVDDNPMYPKPFFPDLEPISFVRGCAINLLYGAPHDDDLYNQCLRWEKWIPRT